jgi:hypothetical protein
MQLPTISHRRLETSIKEAIERNALDEEFETWCGYLERAKTAELPDLFLFPAKEVTKRIASAKKVAKKHEGGGAAGGGRGEGGVGGGEEGVAAERGPSPVRTTAEDERKRKDVASAPSSSAASAPSASASDLQPRLQAQKELPKTLNAAGEDGSDADTGADVSHAAALETGKGKTRDEDAGQGICNLRAVQARLFPFKMFPVCAVVASASFLCA